MLPDVMATPDLPTPADVEAWSSHARETLEALAHGRAFDRAATLTALWVVAGMFYDGWTHAHHAGPESVLTLSHGVMYSGFGAAALVLVGATWLRRSGPAGSLVAWQAAVPDGYGWALLGVPVFLVGGAGDMLWHMVFGIEESVEALLSPTHLALGVGLGLIVTGPLRAAWRRGGARARLTWPSAAWPLLSAGMLWGLIGFFAQYANPLVRPWVATWNEPTQAVFPLAAPYPTVPEVTGGLHAADVAQLAGVAGILVFAASLAGVLVPLARRWRLPMGAFTLTVGLQGVFFGAMRELFVLVPAMLVAGFLLDLAYQGLAARNVGWSGPVLAGLIPAVPLACYLVAIAMVAGLWWTVHLWAGSIVLAAIAGGLVGALASLDADRSGGARPAQPPVP